MAPAPALSVVIPVYRNEESLPELCRELGRLGQLIGEPLEVVFVVDGSPDGSFAWLRDHLPGQPFASKLCLHSRNFGSFAAIRSGLAEATGSLFAVLAADLQEPVEMVADFFRVLRSGEADIAIGHRTGRSDPLLSRLSSQLFWWLYRKLVLPEVPPGGVDMFGCTRQCRDRLLQLEEQHSSLVGLLFWIGFRRRLVAYQRAPRKHGRSAWTLSRKLRYLLDSSYSFSDLPIRLLQWAGALALLFGTGFGAVVLYARLSGRIDVPGYSATVLTVILFGGLNSLGLGMIGEYVWRTFENSKRRPLAIVSAVERFEVES